MPHTLAQATLATNFAEALRLIQVSFVYMDGRIHPPSSMHRLTAEALAEHARDHELWIIRDRESLAACVQYTIRPDCLYVGKLSVAAPHRRQGLARRLLAHAEARARALGLPAVELQTRIELTENHRTFAAMGFIKTAESAHLGYDRPTSITMRKLV